MIPDLAPILLPSAIIGGLILLNALFVAAEFAIVGSSRARIEQRAREGNPLAALVRPILDDPRKQDRYIATAQLGITSASLALGMYGEHLLAEALAERLAFLGEGRWLGAHAVGSVSAVAFLTYLHVVLGEMVPKSLALQGPGRMAMAVAIPMRAMEWALLPLVLLFNGIGNGILKLLGVDRSAHSDEQYRTVDELSFIVAESRAQGVLGREPARVVQELLDFDNLTAGEVMVPRTRVVALPVDASREQLRAVMMEQERHTRYPVYDGDLDHIVGAVHVKDLLTGLTEDERRSEGGSSQEGGAGDQRASAEPGLDRSRLRTLPFVPRTASLDRIIGAMQGSRSQMAVVMDEHGGTAGVVTLEDLFEEVVGDIADPGETPAVRRDEAGRISVAGTVRLDELGEALGMDLSRDEVDTVSGLIITTLGRPPRVGDRVDLEEIVLEVSAIRGRGVEEAHVLAGDGDSADELRISPGPASDS